MCAVYRPAGAHAARTHDTDAPHVPLAKYAPSHVVVRPSLGTSSGIGIMLVHANCSHCSQRVVHSADVVSSTALVSRMKSHCGVATQ